MSFLLALVEGFASGIFVRSLFHVGWPAAAFALLLATILIVVPSLFEGQRSIYKVGALFFILLALGIGRAALADSPLPPSFSAQVKHRVAYHGVVVGEPDVRDASTRIPVRVSSGNETTVVLAVVSRATAARVGDRVYVSGTLALPAAFASDDGRVFRYDKYLQKDGIRFLLNYAYLSVDAPAPWYSLPALLARMKRWFLGGLEQALPEPYASLAGGIVIGGKSGLGTSLEDAFIASGLVQVIVLSGYNVMVVAEWVMELFAYARLPRRVQAAGGTLALILFVGIAGASSTAIRAALMALIALYAHATGRTYAAGRALLLVVLLMLLYNPLFLAFDPGFALSVAATAGLIAFQKPIEVRLAFLRSAFWREAGATTLAAQLGVLPLLLYFTGNLSFIAVPANLAVMPIMPAAMGFSALAGITGGLLPQTLAIALALPAYASTAYVIAVARLSAALPFAHTIIPAFPFVAVLLAYAALAVAASNRFSTTLQLRFARKAST